MAELKTDLQSFVDNYDAEVPLLPRNEWRVVIRGPEITRWIEAVYYEEQDDLLYGWYHTESIPILECPGVTNKVFPKIGAMLSKDGGKTWDDLGTVISEDPKTFDCNTPNNYFVGGAGDFSVAFDYATHYLYFFFSSYSNSESEQGISMARLQRKDLRSPSGKAVKWKDGSWSSPGIGGRSTPIISSTGWHSLATHAYWGPSVHWNSYLEKYILIASLATDSGWASGGNIILTTKDLSDPREWSPIRDLGNLGWYSQIFGGVENFKGSDRLAGRVAKVFRTDFRGGKLVYISDYNIELVRTEGEPSHQNLLNRLIGFRDLYQEFKGKDVSFDHWNFFYLEVVGLKGPDPYEVGLDPEDRGNPVDIHSWWEKVRAFHENQQLQIKK